MIKNIENTSLLDVNNVQMELTKVGGPQMGVATEMQDPSITPLCGHAHL